MNKIFKNPKVTFSIGFLILPLFLFIFCTVLNLFAPSALKFPKAAITFIDIIGSLSEKKVLVIFGHTFFNVFVSLSVSLIFGVLLGLILGYNKKIWNFSQPTVDFFRSIPITFLIPAAALLVGSTSKNIVWILSSYPCMLIIILNVRAGLSKQETERVLAFSIISGSNNPFKKFFCVTFHEILPDISTGFRIALSYCIVIVTVLEYMNIGNNGSYPGIGKLINEEFEQLNYPRVYALIFLIGIVGFILNKMVELLDHFFLNWSKDTSNVGN